MQHASSQQVFVIIPAAGLSRRMGRPKLLLELGGQSVLARLITALQSGLASHRENAAVTTSLMIFVVTRKDDFELAQEAQRCDVEVISPDVDPPDMRTSVTHAIEVIESRCHPNSDDLWLLVPADHPVLEPSIVRQLLSAWDNQHAEIMVPTHQGRRGHPTLWRWSVTAEVKQIPLDEGLNALVRSKPERVIEVEFDDDAVLIDLDTPADYERLRLKA